MINWQKIKKVHLTGIKGVGMTALACCLKDLGVKVTGSDTDEVFVTDEVLKKKKISWREFSPAQITSEIDLLIFTGAHQGEENPEVKKAKKLGIEILTQGEALGELMSAKPIGISVCGVGGKTTTAAMTATLLDFLNGHPSYAIGVGMINPLGVPGRFDKKGKIFVAEADEYMASPSDPTPKFFYQNPKVIVLTNLEYDHPDIYRRFSETKAAFKSFVEKLPPGGLLLASADSENSRAFLEELAVPVQTFGFSGEADWQIKNYRITDKGASFSLRYKKLFLEEIQIRVPGGFNALNAVAALAVVNFLGFSLQEAASFLKRFKGTKRRFEFIQEIQGRKLFDDYAHHPKQLRATLEAAKKICKKGKLWAIFQSHTYSRTRGLFKEFTQSFTDADWVIITPIYASAREKKDKRVSGKILAGEIAQFQPRVFYLENQKQVAQLLKEKSQVGDIIFTLGAGDIFQWHEEIIESLRVLGSKSMKKKLIKLLGKEKLKFDEPLKNHTTFKIGGPAAYFYEAESVDELVGAVKAALNLELDFFILGGGSNLLVADRGYKGLVIKNKTSGLKILGEGEIEAESGVRINKLVEFSLNCNLVGFEEFVMIPGTIGGAVFTNIHGPKSLIGDLVQAAVVLTREGEIKEVETPWFRFRYDYSFLQKTGDIVLKVVFKLKIGEKEKAEKRIQEILKKKITYPKVSAGCIFKNLPKQTVGFLIDQKLGLKGKRVGDAQISGVHAGFIENLGKAKAGEVMRLIKLIQEKAQQKLRVTFEPEIVFLGFTKKELEDAKVHPAPLT